MSVLGAVAAIGSAIVGGLTGYSSTESTNNTNLRIARESNAFNAAEAEKARQFNASEAAKNRAFQWQTEQSARQWNSEAAQMARNRAAGINPYMANIDGGSAQSAAGSAASGSPAAAVSPPHMERFDPMASIAAGFQNYVSLKNLENESDLKSAQTELLRQQGISQAIQNDYANNRIILELASMRSMISSSDIDSRYKEKLISDIDNRIRLFNDTYDAQKVQPVIQNDFIRAQEDYYKAAKLLHDSNVKVNDEKIANFVQERRESAQRIFESMKRIDSMDADIEVKKAEKEKIVAEEAETWLRALGIDQTNKLYPTLKRKYEAEIRSLNRFQHNSQFSVLGVGGSGTFTEIYDETDGKYHQY